VEWRVVNWAAFMDGTLLYFPGFFFWRSVVRHYGPPASVKLLDRSYIDTSFARKQFRARWLAPLRVVMIGIRLATAALRILISSSRGILPSGVRMNWISPFLIISDVGRPSVTL